MSNSKNIVGANKTEGNGIIYEYDALRIIACLLVVVGHASYLALSSVFGGVDYSGFLSGNIGKISGIFLFFCNANSFVYQYHMPLFFALSGAIYCIDRIRKNKYQTFDQLVEKKFKRLIVPYLLVGILYQIPIKLISGYYDINSTFKAIFIGFLRDRILDPFGF